jgi:hypothetical protein
MKNTTLKIIIGSAIGLGLSAVGQDKKTNDAAAKSAINNFYGVYRNSTVNSNTLLFFDEHIETVPTNRIDYAIHASRADGYTNAAPLQAIKHYYLFKGVWEGDEVINVETLNKTAEISATNLSITLNGDFIVYRTVTGIKIVPRTPSGEIEQSHDGVHERVIVPTINR